MEFLFTKTEFSLYYNKQNMLILLQKTKNSNIIKFTILQFIIILGLSFNYNPSINKVL